MLDNRLQAGVNSLRADARRHEIRTWSCKHSAEAWGRGRMVEFPWSIPCFLILTSPSIPLENTLAYQEDLLLASSDARCWQI